MLQVTNLALRRGAKLLFSAASFQVYPGHRVGVTGVNGCGKSSLFALLCGELTADAGEATFPKDWMLAHVAQETPADPRAALEYVLDGDGELRAVQSALRAAECANDGQRLAELHAQFDLIGGYDAPSRAARLLHGLGFLPGQEHQSVASFSGGWRMRLNLARALMCRSDLLLLDEPTNHLDLEAVIWLEAWLKSYRGALLLISHDRDFLDGVCTHVLHVEQGAVNMYNGNYSAFERLRAARLAQQQAVHARQQREVAHMQRFIERFKAKASKARQAQSRVKALERMELVAAVNADSPFTFQLQTPDALPHPLLQLKEVSVGYGHTPTLSNIKLSLAPGDRIGLLGVNGAGKSTLIKLLAGEMTPLCGERLPAQALRIGYFAQHQVEQLNVQWSALEHLRHSHPQVPDQVLRDYLGSFAFAGDMATTPVAPFSGGEKARLVLALLVYQKPNLLLLDEPTNHLDLQMRDALALALQDFEGAMVMVSHDRYMLRSTTDRLWLVRAGKVGEFEQSLDDYPRWLAEQEALENPREQAVPMQEAEHSAAARKEKRRQEAELRQQQLPLRQKLAALENDVARLTREQIALTELLSDAGIYEDAQKTRLMQVLAEKQKVDAELSAAEEAWLLLAEALGE